MTQYVIAAALAGLVVLALVAHWLVGHRHAHKTVHREAERWGWDAHRKTHEIRAMKRRHRLRHKVRRVWR